MITFSRDSYDDVVYEAYDKAEKECCGILAGDFDEDETCVEAVYPTDNTADRPEIRYTIDPAEQLETIESLEDDGLDVAGFYHSHPTGPSYPSETDASRATWPGMSYVIVALDGYPYVGSWRWREEEFEQELVRVE